ncbi:MAG: MarR family transcriptional regulator [Pseudomonadota bacterium]
MKAAISDVPSLLFPATYRRQVLALLLLHPERKLHVREIARLTGTTAGTLNKELARLHKAGLLNCERVGNQLQYSANLHHQIYPELASILRKTVGLAGVLIQALTPLAEHIKIAFVFGSMAHGSETAGSDVDLLLIGTLKFGAVIDALYPIQQQLGREVNPKIFSLREWKAKLKAKDAFMAEVVAQPKIFLIGSEHEFAELGRR